MASTRRAAANQPLSPMAGQQQQPPPPPPPVFALSLPVFALESLTTLWDDFGC
jgi:hypothetical protein